MEVPRFSSELLIPVCVIIREKGISYFANILLLTKSKIYFVRGNTYIIAIKLKNTELIIPDSLNFSKDHSLVLINNGGASFNEVINLLNQIQTMIFNKFKIKLEIEPEIVGL